MRVNTTVCALIVIVPRICMADESFRCGSWLVSAHISVAELLNKCGKPSSQEVSIEDVRNLYGATVGTSTSEIWRYDRGVNAGPKLHIPGGRKLHT